MTAAVLTPRPVPARREHEAAVRAERSRIHPTAVSERQVGHEPPARRLGHQPDAAGLATGEQFGRGTGHGHAARLRRPGAAERGHLLLAGHGRGPGELRVCPVIEREPDSVIHGQVGYSGVQLYRTVKIKVEPVPATPEHLNT